MGIDGGERMVLPVGAPTGCLLVGVFPASVLIVLLGLSARDPEIPALICLAFALVFLRLMSWVTGFEPGAGYILDRRSRLITRRPGWGRGEPGPVAAFDEIARVRLYNPLGWRIYIRLERRDGGLIPVSDTGGPRSHNVDELRERARAAASLLNVPFEDDTSTWGYGR
jgi:hypothetical protein